MHVILQLLWVFVKPGTPRNPNHRENIYLAQIKSKDKTSNPNLQQRGGKRDNIRTTHLIAFIFKLRVKFVKTIKARANIRANTDQTSSGFGGVPGFTNYLKNTMLVRKNFSGHKFFIDIFPDCMYNCHFSKFSLKYFSNIFQYDCDKIMICRLPDDCSTEPPAL